LIIGAALTAVAMEHRTDRASRRESGFMRTFEKFREPSIPRETRDFVSKIDRYLAEDDGISSEIPQPRERRALARRVALYIYSVNSRGMAVGHRRHVKGLEGPFSITSSIT
jgi:hypothetical protein